MEVKNYPVRQCIGCRKVRPKSELLRFTKAQAGSAVFDASGTLQGRGFYLCPDAGCFREVYRNKRIRGSYFKNKENAEDMIREVEEKLLKLINNDLIFCKKIGYLNDILEEDNNILDDRLVSMGADNPRDEKVKKHSAAIAVGDKIILPTAVYADRTQGNSVNTGYPITERLIMNLQKYGMLSSKGPAL